MNAVLDGQVSLPLRSPDAVAVWAVLEPLAETLFQSLLRTGPDALKKSSDGSWKALEAAIQNLGIPEEAFEVFKVNAGWWQLSPSEMKDRKLAFLHHLGSISTEEIVRRYRVSQTQELTKRFYQKRRTQNATRENVLTKKLERILSGFFAGDWLEFLTYIEERPEAGDAVHTELPSPIVVPGLNEKALDVAKSLNLAPDKVQEVADSLFPGAAGANPIRERLGVLKEFWSTFLDLHTQQASGMPSLWGLVHQYERVEIPAAVTPERAARFGPPAQYKRHLDGVMQQKIEKLWGTRVVARYPERRVTNLTPYYWMAHALGPALEFWEGVFLTAWYVTEGPYSRTDLQGMEAHYSKQLDRLSSLEAPVDRRVFEELRQAEAQLGPPEHVAEVASEKEIYPGLSLKMSFGGFERRKGFSILRDIISRYAREWTREHFESYLEGQWKAPLERISTEASKRLASKGRPMTVRQFASLAEPTANEWFGGDLTAVSVAILQPSPVSQRHEPVVTGDVIDRANHLYHQWTEVARQYGLKTNVEDYSDNRPYFQAEELTRLGLEYLQLWELLGEKPSYEQFIKPQKSYEKDVITRLLKDVGEDREVLWSLFTSVATSEPSKPSPNDERPDQAETKGTQPSAPAGTRVTPQATSEKPKPLSGWLKNLFARTPK